jgi:DNA repair ATPase RecN
MSHLQRALDHLKAAEAKNYESLREILAEALKQASEGKGKERHAMDGEPFEKQPICEIARRLGGGDLFQAVKKIYESVRLPKEAAVRELLGAINYIAAEIILRREAP